MDRLSRGSCVPCAERVSPRSLLPVFLPFFSILFFLSDAALRAETPDSILLLAFTSEGCPACRALEPLVSGLEQKGYPLRRVSPHDATGSALYDQYGIETMPSFVLLRGGMEESRFISRGEDIRVVQDRLLTMFRDAQNTQRETAPKETPSSALAAAGSPKAPPAREISARTENMNKELAATVRLRVSGGKNETDCGTGTLIHTSLTENAREGLVLTCGHLFRDSKGNAPVQVDLFRPESGKTTTVTGECVYYDDDLDIGFVGIPLPFEIEPVRMAPPGYAPQSGDRLVSLGCTSGEDPTIWEHTVKSTDQKYYQPKDRLKNQQFYFIEVTNAPRSGRSGGGLFARTAQGQTYLIGVCNAGDPKSDEGYFLPYTVVYDQLYANSNLAFVYQELLRGEPSESGNIQTVSFDEAPLGRAAPEKIRQPNFESGGNDARLAKLDELKKCVEAGAEVICIVNWPKENEGRERESEVIRVPRKE